MRVISSESEPLYLQPPGLSQGHLLGWLLPPILQHQWKARRWLLWAQWCFPHATFPQKDGGKWNNGKGVNCGGGRDRAEITNIHVAKKGIGKGGGDWGDMVWDNGIISKHVASIHLSPKSAHIWKDTVKDKGPKSKQDRAGGKKNQGQAVWASEPPCQSGEKPGPFGEKLSPPTEAPLLALVPPWCPLSPAAISRSAPAEPQPFHSTTLLETPSLCTSSTSRKSFSALSEERIPGKQMSCTWKNFALYLISLTCSEPTASFNQCRLWKQPRHSWAALGHKAMLRDTRGDIADKGRADPAWPRRAPMVAYQGQNSFCGSVLNAL